MNAHKHMEAIFGGVLIIGCIVALMPTQKTAQPWAAGPAAGPAASSSTPSAVSPMPVVVITAKRMTSAEKRDGDGDGLDASSARVAPGAGLTTAGR